MSYPTDNTAITQIVDGAGYPRATNVNPAFSDLDGVKTMLGVNGVGWIAEGQMYNGKLSVTVAANNLTVAIKTLAGADPSAALPVYVRINGTIRKITAALSVTKNAGTNWFNSGSAELAAKEVDYFAYLLWNTTPATDIVDLGISRVPYFNVYSEASGTTTNEKYLAFANASTPTATDDMVNIGRFAATLSAGAGYTWTVPTYTSVNLVQKPCLETRVLTYTPTITGYSAVPTAANCVYQYYIVNRTVKIQLSEDTTGTSNATTKTYSVPFTAKTLTNKYWGFNILAPMNNGAFEANGYGVIPSAGTVLTMNRSAGAAWTNSGNCIAAYRCNAEYETA
jgi:hypothetical protein